MQFAPFALPQVHAPHVRESAAPVYHSDRVVPAGHEGLPSNIVHFGTAVAGTQTWPLPQPPPTVGTQNLLVLDQVTGTGVAVPEATHAPDRIGVNMVVCTP